MDFQEIVKRVHEIHKLYVKSDIKRLGKEWNRGEYVRALSADIGMLTKLTMAKDGLREVENVDEKLKHEIADCLWALIIISEKYGVDIEESFLETMKVLEKRASNNELHKSHNS